jgi:hypothetical protein
MGTGSFPGVKRPGRGVDNPLPSSTEVKERVELYLYSPFGTSWAVMGWTLCIQLWIQNCIFPPIVKAVPLQAWSGPEASRKLRFPDYMTTAHDGGGVVSLTHRPPLHPGNAPCTDFCQRLSRPQGHSAIGRIMSMKNSNDTIWNWTRRSEITQHQNASYKVKRSSFPHHEGV